MPEPAAFHHVTLTVTDLTRSVAWYESALRLEKVADREGDGWVRSLMRAPSGFMLGLTEHDGTAADSQFDHLAVGLDHLSISCADRGEVEEWATQLDAANVEHGEIVDAAAGHLLVCRDPDNIAVEFFAPLA